MPRAINLRMPVGLVLAKISCIPVDAIGLGQMSGFGSLVTFGIPTTQPTFSVQFGSEFLEIKLIRAN